MTAALAEHPQVLRSGSSGLWWCAAAMVTLGTCVPLARGLLSYPTLLGQGLRYGLAALVLYLAAAILRLRILPTPRGQWLWLAAIAALSLVPYNVLLLAALRHGAPSAVAVILGCAPLVLAVAEPLWRGHRLHGRIGAAAVIVVAGTAVVHGSGTVDMIGVLCAVGALTADVAFSLLAASVLPSIGPVGVAAGGCALSVPVFAVAAVATGEVALWRVPTVGEATVIAVLAVVLTAGSFPMWFRGLQQVGVARAGITISLVPVTTLIVTAVQDQTWPGAGQTAGVAAVAAGLAIGLSQRTRRP